VRERVRHEREQWGQLRRRGEHEHEFGFDAADLGAESKHEGDEHDKTDDGNGSKQVEARTEERAAVGAVRETRWTGGRQARSQERRPAVLLFVTGRGRRSSGRSRSRGGRGSRSGRGGRHRRERRFVARLARANLGLLRGRLRERALPARGTHERRLEDRHGGVAAAQRQLLYQPQEKKI
jgi:hypothetical protein